MIVLIITDLDKFPLRNSEKDSKWQPLNNTVSGVYWLSIEAKNDLDINSIEYTEGEIEIKKEEL